MPSRALKPDIVLRRGMGYDPAGPYAGRQASTDLESGRSGAYGLGGLARGFAPFPAPAVPYIAARRGPSLPVIAPIADATPQRDRPAKASIGPCHARDLHGFLMAEHPYGETFIRRPANSAITTRSPLSPTYRTKDGWSPVLLGARVQAARFSTPAGSPDAYEERAIPSKTAGKDRVAEYYAMMADAATATHRRVDGNLAPGPAYRPCAQYPVRDFRRPQLKQNPVRGAQLEGKGLPAPCGRACAFPKTAVSIRRDPRDRPGPPSKVGGSGERRRAILMRVLSRRERAIG